MNTIVEHSGLIIATGLAFIPVIRREIFRRDRGTCQCVDCIGQAIVGASLEWKNGWHMQAAHFTDMHQPFPDSNPNHGQLLCSIDHIWDELERGNHKGVALLYEKQTIRNKSWLESHGWKDQKPPLTMFYDYFSADDKEGFGRKFAEMYNIF